MITTQSRSEQALHRIMRYLEMSDVNITPPVEKRALALITEALECHPDDPLPNCMSRLSTCFDLPMDDSPCQAPPVHRGSLGYGDY